jgi:hypothetical protein
MDAALIQHKIQPYFNMEAYMALSQERRLGGTVVERLAELWEQWLPLLQVYEVRGEKISWLVVWLPESVEKQVDESWKNSQSDGWLINVLAQFICMCAVQEMLPEVEENRCAPSPRPLPVLREALTRLRTPYKENSDTLSLRYALVTHYPYKGGCEICHLQTACPKGKEESPSVVLPGYEKPQEPACG